jgi:hypothetical protein
MVFRLPTPMETGLSCVRSFPSQCFTGGLNKNACTPPPPPNLRDITVSLLPVPSVSSDTPTVASLKCSHWQRYRSFT